MTGNQPLMSDASSVRRCVEMSQNCQNFPALRAGENLRLKFLLGGGREKKERFFKACTRHLGDQKGHHQSFCHPWVHAHWYQLFTCKVGVAKHEKLGPQLILTRISGPNLNGRVRGLPGRLSTSRSHKLYSSIPHLRKGQGTPYSFSHPRLASYKV